MFEPVSSTIGIVCLGYAGLSNYARRSTAVSSEAAQLRDVAVAVVGFGEQSQALFGAKSAAISELRALASDCSEAGWDGDGAFPADQAAVSATIDFLRAFPDALRLPEFAIDPDGAVSLDWIESKTRIFSLRVGPTNRLAFAWLDGSDRGHGVVRFSGDQIPTRIIVGIEEIVGHGNVAVGAW